MSNSEWKPARGSDSVYKVNLIREEKSKLCVFLGSVQACQNLRMSHLRLLRPWDKKEVSQDFHLLLYMSNMYFGQILNSSQVLRTIVSQSWSLSSQNTHLAFKNMSKSILRMIILLLKMLVVKSKTPATVISHYCQLLRCSWVAILCTSICNTGHMLAGSVGKEPCYSRSNCELVSKSN